MMVSGYQPAGFANSMTSLSGNVAGLASSTLQSGEVLLLQVQSNTDEALLVTTARVIVLKGALRSAQGKPFGRFFPVDSITGIKTSGILGIDFIAIITPQTASEPIPLFSRWRCTFGVTFASRKLCGEVATYLNGLIAHMGVQHRAAIVNGPLRPIAPSAGVAVGPNEQFYVECPAVYFAEHSYTQYQGGTQGMSFRVMPGVYYRVGGIRGRSQRQQTLEPDDRGHLLISNQRVLFVGARKTLSILNQHISAVDVFADGVKIGVANKSTMQFSTPDETVGLLLRRVLNIP